MAVHRGAVQQRPVLQPCNLSPQDPKAGVYSGGRDASLLCQPWLYNDFWDFSDSPYYSGSILEYLATPDVSNICIGKEPFKLISFKEDLLLSLRASLGRAKNSISRSHSSPPPRPLTGQKSSCVSAQRSNKLWTLNFTLHTVRQRLQKQYLGKRRPFASEGMGVCESELNPCYAGVEVKMQPILL